MSTHDARALYSALLDGDLSPEEHADWHAALALDTDLAADYAGFAAGVGALRGLRPQALSESRVAAILAPLDASAPAAARPAWPQLLAGLATAAAIWWLLVLGGIGQLIDTPSAGTPLQPPPRGSETLASHSLPEAPPTMPEPWALPADAAVVADAAVAADLSVSTAPAPLHAQGHALGALEPGLKAGEGRPRLRASAGVHLVRGEQSTRLSLHGELSALIPELLALLDSEDAGLIQLATTRLRQAQRDLVERGSVPAELGTDPLARDDNAHRPPRNWFSARPTPPPSVSQAWNEWWTLARVHLPRAHDSDVL
ncbi:MAG: hypothetical protein DHS20C15_25710 [Planctomycetota bacterium]|nr:MAG: hypothetical protein DHS20C15_25710 [Planctomycetota bacterium]